MSVVVTGATGHLGPLVVQHLLAGGLAADQIVAGGRRQERLVDLGVRTAAVARERHPFVMPSPP